MTLAERITALATTIAEKCNAIEAKTGKAVSYRDEKSSGTEGGTFTSGAWQTRTLNTESTIDSIGASLSSNQITLPAGTYLATWSAPAFYVGYHQTRLYNVTDSSVIGIGNNSYARPDGSAHQTHSHGSQVFTLTASKVLRLEHRCSATLATKGFGLACSFGTEVYAEISFLKLG